MDKDKKEIFALLKAGKTVQEIGPTFNAKGGIEYVLKILKSALC